MKYLLLIASALLSNQAISSDHSETSENLVGQFISPCDSWDYSSDARGYVCWMRPRRIEVVTPRDLDSLIIDLRAKIDDLQRQIDELKNNHPKQ